MLENDIVSKNSRTEIDQQIDQSVDPPEYIVHMFKLKHRTVCQVHRQRSWVQTNQALLNRK